MKPAFYTGASGLIASQSRMDVIGNNIANVNTVGYKPTGSSFSDLLYTEMYVNTENDPLTGHGVKTFGTGINAQQSNLLEGQSVLDLAILGKGWFCVEKDGQRLYTRDGSFGISLNGDEASLVNQSGAYVLDTNGNRITTRITAAAAGIDYEALTSRAGVFGFDYTEALTPVSGNLYAENELTGPAASLAEGEYELVTGYLEQSKVSLADEMVNLIAAQRAYQLSARVVQTADEIEQTVNSLRS